MSSTLGTRKIYRSGSSFIHSLPLAWVKARMHEHKLTPEDFCKRGITVETVGDKLMIQLVRNDNENPE